MYLYHSSSFRLFNTLIQYCALCNSIISNSFSILFAECSAIRGVADAARRLYRRPSWWCARANSSSTCVASRARPVRCPWRRAITTVSGTAMCSVDRIWRWPVNRNRSRVHRSRFIHQVRITRASHFLPMSSSIIRIIRIIRHLILIIRCILSIPMSVRWLYNQRRLPWVIQRRQPRCPISMVLLPLLHHPGKREDPGKGNRRISRQWPRVLVSTGSIQNGF